MGHYSCNLSDGPQASLRMLPELARDLRMAEVQAGVLQRVQDALGGRDGPAGFLARIGRAAPRSARVSCSEFVTEVGFEGRETGLQLVLR
ncbi:MAG: hypothetical protein IPK19_13180 [Chloroflexi bacterium]|nr:hypothetical protein [Chloroflexota bacterium]